jgi:enoyl-CoA hydratase/carnithine racemase
MTENVVLLERERDIAVVRLCRGVTNALDLKMVTELAHVVHLVEVDPSFLGLVLASNNDKFLSIGFDLPNLVQLAREDCDLFFRTFNQVCVDLFALSKPTAAAITGHAIAGGCILTLCCDYRLIGEGRKLMGLNEIKLGVPVPYVADCILRALVGYRNARQVMEMGDFYSSDELLRLALVDQVLPQEQVVSESIAKVRALGAMPGKAFSLIKANRVDPVLAEIRGGLEDRERSFIESWYSEAARERLKEAARKF